MPSYLSVLVGPKRADLDACSLSDMRGSAPVNCLAAGVCSEKGQGEPGLVEAERGFSMAIVEGWNQWAATIYILNQWQFPAGK